MASKNRRALHTRENKIENVSGLKIPLSKRQSINTLQVRSTFYLAYITVQNDDGILLSMEGIGMTRVFYPSYHCSQLYSVCPVVSWGSPKRRHSLICSFFCPLFFLSFSTLYSHFFPRRFISSLFSSLFLDTSFTSPARPICQFSLQYLHEPRWAGRYLFLKRVPLQQPTAPRIDIIVQKKQPIRCGPRPGTLVRVIRGGASRKVLYKIKFQQPRHYSTVT